MLASSADITTAPAAEPLRSALLVRSNPLGFNVVDDPAWAHSVAATYAERYDQLCLGDSVAEQHRSQCFDIAQRVTYLDTADSLATEVRFFDGRNHGWANGFWEAIQQTLYPAEAVRFDVETCARSRCRGIHRHAGVAGKLGPQNRVARCF